MVHTYNRSRDAGDTAFAVRNEPRGGTPYHGLVRELLSRWTNETTAPVIGITSAGHRSGVTTIAAHLGVCAAEISHRPALLIDCNANSSDLLAHFRTSVSCGVREVVAGDYALDDCVYETCVPNLCILGPGNGTRGTANANEAQGWLNLLRKASQKFGVVILDLPPVAGLLSEVASLQGIDRLLLVIEAERTRRQAVARTKSQLSRIGIELSGIILNKRRKHIPGWIYRRI
ncbi:MAG: hypothetical protein H6822_35650 [Planctomycetaceae bacterium]|nr:hypothetical protein [Planctomycetales bacterium]MCB9927524.1 hypothetical protein [Planctomycetaceae bacterium]